MPRISAVGLHTGHKRRTKDAVFTDLLGSLIGQKGCSSLDQSDRHSSTNFRCSSADICPQYISVHDNKCNKYWPIMQSRCMDSFSPLDYNAHASALCGAQLRHHRHLEVQAQPRFFSQQQYILFANLIWIVRAMASLLSRLRGGSDSAVDPEVEHERNKYRLLVTAGKISWTEAMRQSEFVSRIVCQRFTNCTISSSGIANSCGSCQSRFCLRSEHAQDRQG